MISICIATYNGEKYIYQQIKSILSQLKSNDEIIISDDLSSDKTIEEINKLKDPRIKIFINSSRKGVVRNFENAIKHSSGEYIFLSDQDDIWIENKVSKYLPLLTKYDLVISDNTIVNDNLEPIRLSFFDHHFSPKILENIWKNNYIGCCMAFRRNLINYIIPFPSSIMHDVWIGIIAQHYGSVYFLDESLILYRRHNNNTSTCGEKSKNSITKKLSYRVRLIYFFIKRIIKIYRLNKL